MRSGFDQLAKKCRICGRADSSSPCTDCDQEIKQEVDRRASMEQLLEATEAVAHRQQRAASAALGLIEEHERELFRRFVLADSPSPEAHGELVRFKELAVKLRSEIEGGVA